VILEVHNVYLVDLETMKLIKNDIDARSSAAGAITHDTVVATPCKHHF
jgi:hypothetical protein